MRKLDHPGEKLQIPMAYVEGYGKACAVNESLAKTYIRHTTIGDPVLDPVVDELADLQTDILHKFAEAGIMRDESLREAPAVLRKFFDELGHVPIIGPDPRSCSGPIPVHNGSSATFQRIAGAGRSASPSSGSTGTSWTSLAAAGGTSAATAR